MHVWIVAGARGGREGIWLRFDFARCAWHSCLRVQLSVEQLQGSNINFGGRFRIALGLAGCNGIVCGAILQWHIRGSRSACGIAWFRRVLYSGSSLSLRPSRPETVIERLTARQHVLMVWLRPGVWAKLFGIETCRRKVGGEHQQVLQFYNC